MPIQKYVDYFPEKTFNGDKVTITPRMLMSHTSGVRHYDKELPKKNDETSEQTNTDNSGKEKSNSKGEDLFLLVQSNLILQQIQRGQSHI